MPCYRLIAFLPILILLAAAPAARAAGFHAVHWNKYATEHFDIVFHDEVRPQADEALRFLEPAYAKIAKDLGMRERGVRISVVLTGQPDESNGSATPLGHTILIYTRPAQVMAAGDIAWLKRVLAHELAHQITFLALRKGFWGIYSELYKASHLPAWFFEGLAQYAAETWDAKRNTFFAHALFNSALEPYPDLAVYTKYSPVSNRLVYEQGHAFVRFIADREGPDFWARVLKRIRVIPLWSEVKALLSPLTAAILPLENAVRAESGEGIRHHYRDFTDSLRAAVPRKTEPSGPWTDALDGFAIVWQIRKAPDGSLWFTAQRDWETAATDLFRMRPGAGAVKEVSAVDPVFDLSADGKRVLYVRGYSDPDRLAVEKLFLLDAETGRSRFVSDGASHPVFWGTDSVAFPHYRKGRQTLAFCALSGGCRDAAPDSLVGFFALSPSANGLLLNATDADGRTGIYEYARGGDFSLLFRDTVTAEFPVEASDGGVWMLRDRGGLLQVDGLDRATGAVRPVATFPLGCFFPQRIAPGEFAAVAQTGGSKAWTMQPVRLKPPPPPSAPASAFDSASAIAADTAGKSPTDSATAALADSSNNAKAVAAQAPVGPAAGDTIPAFRAPEFLASPVAVFPSDSGMARDSGEYNGFTAMRPLIAGPASFPIYRSGALGAFVLVSDPLGIHSLSFAGSPSDFENALYEGEYVNNASAIQLTLAASNTDYRFRSVLPVSGWARMGLESRRSGYSARIDFPMPAALPLGHQIWFGLKGRLSITDWRLAGSRDSTAMEFLEGIDWRDKKLVSGFHLAYSFFRPNAYAFVHPLLKTDLEIAPGLSFSDSNPEPRLYLYARQTVPLWRELTFTARYQGSVVREDLIPHSATLDGTPIGFHSGTDGDIHDAYAGMDFPIHKGFMGEWPLLGLWNYLGGGAYFGYEWEGYEDYPGRPGSGYEWESGAVGAKLDMLFHVMRRAPIVLSYAIQYDYLRGNREFRIGLEADGIPRSLSLQGVSRNRFRSPAGPR